MQQLQSPDLIGSITPVADQPIVRSATATVAFVGRALRGPVNRPCVLRNFGEYQTIFGGLWQPSALSYAIEQFFESGGVLASVVRVVNGGRPVSLTLPVSKTQVLTLEAVCPGTREFLRAAVDYDNIPPADLQQFNLVVQRVRAPGSEHVEDQEIYTRLSMDPGSVRYVSSMLASSSLVRVRGSVPMERPRETHRADGRSLAAYANSNPDGDDGGPLTDYDVIGSATDGTGLFAFSTEQRFNFLCMPPLARDQPLGPSVLLVAARFCRERRALLFIDPPPSWDSPDAAFEGMRSFAFTSDNAVMYFPAIQAYDRLRGHYATFAPSAAAAGMLSRLDGLRPVWAAEDGDDAPLRPGLKPGCAVSDEWRARLAQVGINTLVATRSRRIVPARTLAGARASTADWRYLAAKRFALLVVDSIESGTRWSLAALPGVTLWKRLHAQVADFFSSLEAEGAFSGKTPGTGWFVIADERINTPRHAGEVRLLVGCGAQREGEWNCWLVTHTTAGSRVQQVSMNRLQSAAGQPPMDPDLDVATVLEERFFG